MWNAAGCTTSLLTPNPSIGIGNLDESAWKTWNKAQITSEASGYATNPQTKSTCYAPVPVVQTGSTINIASLWGKPWVAINDGTNATTLSQFNDGTIACTVVGFFYTRPNLSTDWTEVSGPNFTTISTGQNGKCLHQPNGEQSNYSPVELWGCGSGDPGEEFNYDSSTKAITLNDGLCVDALGAGTSPNTPVIQYQCNGGLNQQWVYGADKTLRPQHAPNMCLDFTSYNDGTGVVIYPCYSTLSQIWNINQVISLKGVIQLSNGTYVGVGLDNNLYTKTVLTAAWNGPVVYGLMSVVQMNDGTLLGVGPDNMLYKSRNDISSGIPWNKITCPASCCVTFVSILNDGTIVCVGTNGLVYTRNTTDSPWVLADGSMAMSSVTQLKDGTIIGTSQAGWFFRK